MPGVSANAPATVFDCTHRILANTSSGVRIAWLTKRKAFSRFLTSLWQNRDLFGDNNY
ncbi:MAG: hypothetical protein QNJ54_22850 [Prochloraceae cyanobacterium]|nr:hypothetical protein [Prochloraceae cyanobacterium]